MSEYKFTLKELRARHNLKQSDVAKKVGVSTKTYQLIENDYESFLSSRWVTIAKIADLYKIDMSQIFLPADVILNHIKLDTEI